MPPAPPGVGPESDILTGAVCSYYIPCYCLLHDQINFQVDRFNDLGWSFLGLALTVGCYEIARDIVHQVSYPDYVTSKANVRNMASESIITLAARMGDKRIFEPLYNWIPAGFQPVFLFMHVRRHE